VSRRLSPQKSRWRMCRCVFFHFVCLRSCVFSPWRDIAYLCVPRVQPTNVIVPSCMQFVTTPRCAVNQSSHGLYRRVYGPTVQRTCRAHLTKSPLCTPCTRAPIGRSFYRRQYLHAEMTNGAINWTNSSGTQRAAFRDRLPEPYL